MGWHGMMMARCEFSRQRLIVWIMCRIVQKSISNADELVLSRIRWNIYWALQTNFGAGHLTYPEKISSLYSKAGDFLDICIFCFVWIRTGLLVQIIDSWGPFVNFWRAAWFTSNMKKTHKKTPKQTLFGRDTEIERWPQWQWATVG